MKVWLILVLLLAVLSGCSDGEESLEARTPAPDAVSPESTNATPCSQEDPGCMPQSTQKSDLSAEQMDAAKRIADEDDTLSEVLNGTSYETNVGPIRAQLGVPGTFVTVEYAFSEALHVDHDLPHIDTGHRGGEENPTQIHLPSPGYEVRTSHNTIEAWSLMVIVLLEEGRVVEVLPLPFGPGSNPPTGEP